MVEKKHKNISSKRISNDAEIATSSLKYRKGEFATKQADVEVDRTAEQRLESLSSRLEQRRTIKIAKLLLTLFLILAVTFGLIACLISFHYVRQALEYLALGPGGQVSSPLYPFAIKLLNAARSAPNYLTPLPLRYYDIFMQYMHSEMVFVASKLNLADIIEETQTKSILNLAAETKTNPDSLLRFIRGLTSFGLFQFECLSTRDMLAADSDSYANCFVRNNDMSLMLMSKRADSLKPMVDHMYEMVYGWHKLYDVIKQGTPAVNLTQFWNKLTAEKSSRELMMKAMASTSVFGDKIIAQQYDFSKFNNIADIGGGAGSFLVQVLQQHPSVGGVLFDLPEQIADAKLYWNELYPSLTSRVSFIAGSFFNKIPDTADVYILRNILHDWNDTASIDILKNIRFAMQRREAILLLVENFIVPNDHLDKMHAFMDMHMMSFGGKERTKEQIDVLLKAAGFSLKLHHLFNAPISMIEAVPA